MVSSQLILKGPEIHNIHLQMSVLALIPGGTSSSLPYYPSYRWVTVSASDLDDGDVAATQQRLHALCVTHQPSLVISLGDVDLWMQKGVGAMPYSFARLWLHFDNTSALAEPVLTAAFLESHRTSRDHDHPLISVITSTFNSGHRLQRAYQSLLAQTYDYWEWILWDDSPDQTTFEIVQALAAQDMRIQMYKAPQRSGIIGEMKYRSASLASGEWLVELDHDDRIAPKLFEWVRDIARRHPGTKFIYSDHAELHEEQDIPFSYGEHYAYNYGAYMRQHVRSHPDGPLQPHFISRSAWPNPITLQHLVGLPNHVRIWKRAFYEALGRHRTDLPVADDYDLLLKSFLAADPGDWVCIAAPSYYQYRNTGGNNFTFKRNVLIQHLVQQLHLHFYQQLEAKYNALGWSKEIAWPSTGVWEIDLPDINPRMERYFVPEDQDPNAPCISIVLPTYDSAELLKRAIASIVQQTHNNWRLVIVGDGCPSLDSMAIQDLPELFPSHLDRIQWYNLADRHNDDFTTARNYALRMIVKTTWVAYLEPDGAWAPNHLELLVHACGGEQRNFGACAYVDKNDSGARQERAYTNTSDLIHRLSLVEMHGYWKKNPEGSKYAAQELFERWSAEPWNWVGKG